MTRSRHGWVALAVGSLMVALAPAPGADPAAAQEAADRPASVRVVAAGDIACSPRVLPTYETCQHAATALLAERLQPDRVLALGDLQYPSGSLAAFRKSYRPTWGQLRGRTDPVPGNHEYETPGARGYYRFFEKRQPGPPGYYSRRYGTWRVFVLNTNCEHVDCERELRWFRDRLAKRPTRCTLVAMHHPRYSSRQPFTASPGVVPFSRAAYRRGVDVVLSGHEHNYERFRKMDGDGHRAKRGFVQFVVGTGGASHRPLERRTTGSAHQDDTRFGVLRLRLDEGGYRFAFVPTSGRVQDRGSRTCV